MTLNASFNVLDMVVLTYDYKCKLSVQSRGDLGGNRSFQIHPTHFPSSAEEQVCFPQFFLDLYSYALGVWSVMKLSLHAKNLWHPRAVRVGEVLDMDIDVQTLYYYVVTYTHILCPNYYI